MSSVVAVTAAVAVANRRRHVPRVVAGPHRQQRQHDTKRVIDERIARLTAARKRFEDRRRDQLAEIVATIDELAREEFELVSAAAAAAVTDAGGSANDDVKAVEELDVKFYYTDDDEDK